ncbi:MAG: hypothetical protein ACREMY_00920, partial [bacterium]
MIAVSVAGGLAMVTTWFLVAYCSIPDNDAIYLGLLGFFFVALLDLLLISGLFISNFRQGQGMAAIKWSVGLFLLGLLAASVVGSLPLLWQWLVAVVPGLQDVAWEIVFMLLIPANSLWIRRRSTQDNHGYPRGRLIAQGSLSTVFVVADFVLAIGRFSGGRAWLGTLNLTGALLFGILASQAFVELWKRRRAEPPES